MSELFSKMKAMHSIMTWLKFIDVTLDEHSIEFDEIDLTEIITQCDAVSNRMKLIIQRRST